MAKSGILRTPDPQPEGRGNTTGPVGTILISDDSSPKIRSASPAAMSIFTGMSETDYMTNNELFICRVCGLTQTDMPWGESGEDPSHDICDCCGTEFGYEDSSIDTIKKNREMWLKSGARWWNSKVLPNDWILDEQLENIPLQFR